MFSKVVETEIGQEFAGFLGIYLPLGIGVTIHTLKFVGMIP